MYQTLENLKLKKYFLPIGPDPLGSTKVALCLRLLKFKINN